MKIGFHFLIIAIFILNSCSQSATGNEQDDAVLISRKYAKQIKLITLIDSAIFNDTKQMFKRMKAVYKLTRFADSVKNNIPREGKPGTIEQVGDSAEIQFINDIINIKQEHNVLQFGKFRLLDKDNPHILAYTSSDKKEQLLTILNMDEDNWSFKGDYPFSEMPLLLCNYEDGGLPRLKHSLMVRPFEARIYKVR